MTQNEGCAPGEVCAAIGRNEFHVPGGPTRPDEVLLTRFRECRRRDVNLLLDVPPDRHGIIPTEFVQALARLRANAKL